MAKLSIKDLDLHGKRVFIRVDFNVPLANAGQEITSDKRIRASLPTINYALEHGAGVILASHLGRPKGKPNAEMSMKPVAAKLAELLGKPVTYEADGVAMIGEDGAQPGNGAQEVPDDPLRLQARFEVHLGGQQRRQPQAHELPEDMA